MADCRCTTWAHKHSNDKCDKPAVTNDGYCQECHDQAAKEWVQTKISDISTDPLKKS